MYEYELLSCVKISFDKFIEIMDEISGMDNSYEYYWDIGSDHRFFLKTPNFPNFTLDDIVYYFNVNSIVEMMYNDGMMYIICE